MVSREQLHKSKAIQQRTGRTFHVATRLLPERVRAGTYVLYAFFRVADDVVDDPDPPAPDKQRERLEGMRAVALGERSPEAVREGVGAEAASVLDAFAELRERHDIAPEEVDAFVDAMCRDVAATDYDTHEELAEYLRGSSVAVGNMMLAVMGASDEDAARPHAKALAEAFQLTNFLRDVREDVTDYDRVYLPAASLAEQGCTTADVRALAPTPGLRRTIATELDRTEQLYRRGVAGIRYLPRDCQPAVVLAAVLYADHHRLIRGREYDVFTARPTLSMARRLWLAARTWIAWQRSGDPEETFYRVSTIERVPRGATGGNDADRQVRTRLRSLAAWPIARLTSVGFWGSD